MSTPSEIPAAPPPGRPGVAAPVAGSVAEDLAAIFPDAPPREGRRRLRLGRRSEAPLSAMGRGQGRATAVGALIAAACVGVSAGAFLARAPGSAGPAPSVHSETPRAPGVIAASLPSPGPLAPDPLHARVAPAPAPAVDSVRIHKASARAPARPRKVRAAVCRGSRCASSVMAADARLRRAYAAAARAGVSSRVLADYRDSWARLRHRAPRQPGLVIARYDQMARELDGMAEGRRVAHAAPRARGPWRSLRTELASLWR